MSDNTTLPGTGEVYASDDIGGVKYQRVKACWGIDGIGTDTSSVNPLPVQITPQTNGGVTTWRLIASAGINANVIKGSAGQLYGFSFTNLAASKRYVKLYNKATAPDATSDPANLTYPLFASDHDVQFFPLGIPFSLGIGIGITTGLADNDTGSVTLGDVVVNLYFK